MPFNPKSFLDLCKMLYCSEGEEIIRTIIGRAYFSAFLHAREYFRERKGVSFNEGTEDHQIVFNLLMSMNRSLGVKIQTLRENRNAADYNLNSPAIIIRMKQQRIINQREIYFDKDTAQENIGFAEYVISRLVRRQNGGGKKV